MKIIPVLTRYFMKLIAFVFLLFSYTIYAQQNTELKRYKAPQAKQGVVANKDYFIVFSNDSIVKHDKATGNIAGSFYSKNLKHLNSGVLKNGKLYCAHSNYPEVPMWSSIEIWEENTLEHIGSHSFGIDNGSCTWMDIYNNSYYVFFAHYATPGKMQLNRDVTWSQLVKYDSEWRKIEAWVLPPALVERLTPFSLSGGVITPEGDLLCSHHHNPELYLLAFPTEGCELVLKAIIPSPIPGQAIAFDTFEKGVLWGISRSTQEVIKTKFIR